VATDLQKRTRWEDATRAPLVVLGALFIVAYSADVLVPRQTPLLNATWFILLLLGWIAFAVDYLVRLSLTPRRQRGSFFVHNVIDLLSVFIPVFRALRVVNLLRGIPFFRKRCPPRLPPETTRV
jgi:voltage-gated potassium channel